MILLISTCSQSLHELEFVNPLKQILEEKKISFFIKHYSKLNKNDLKSADKIIICGTSLRDNKFLQHIKEFKWIHNFKKPILGICSGMQIIGVQFGAHLKNKIEIGFYYEDFKRDFLGLKGQREVYHLHNNYITLPKDFENYTSSLIPQAIKHKTKKIYSVLFHPEIRNKELILNFCRK